MVPPCRLRPLGAVRAVRHRPRTVLALQAVCARCHQEDSTMNMHSLEPCPKCLIWHCVVCGCPASPDDVPKDSAA